MAEENEGASKTEDATPRKLEEARKKGDVPKSQDVAPFAALAAAVAVLAMLGPSLSTRLAEALSGFVAHAHELSLTDGGGSRVMYEALLAALSVVGAIGNIGQHGLLWAAEKVKPDLKKLNPLDGFKRLFGPDALINFGKTFIKLLAVAAAAWIAVKPRLYEMQGLSALHVAAILPETLDVLLRMTFAVLLVMGLIAGGDWLIQRMRFAQRMKMTKEELKEDHKQSEGDPHIKAKLKQLRSEKARSRMMQAVPNATVVIMNPTHYAVALRYEQGETAAPLCVAKGVDALALRIRDVAQAHGVAVVEDPPLARALHAAVDVDETIPREHFEAVAKVIGFVMNNSRTRREAGLA